jgi:hypothetical protein
VLPSTVELDNTNFVPWTLALWNVAVTTDQGRAVPASADTAKQHRLRHPAPDTGSLYTTDTIQNGGTHSNIIFSHSPFSFD